MSLLIAQLRSLVRKDFQIIRVHRRKMVAEIIFPMMMTLIACMMLVVIAPTAGAFQSFGDITVPYYSEQCFVNWLGVASPISSQELSEWVAQTGCRYSYSNGITPYSSLQAGVDAWVQNLNTTYASYSAERAFLVGGSNASNLTVLTSPHFGWSPVMDLSQLIAVALMPQSQYPTPLISAVVGQSGGIFTYNFKQMLGTIASLLLSMMFLPLATSTAGRLVDEKRTKVREHLKIMGVRPIAYLTANLVTSMIRVLFAVCCSAAVLLGWGSQQVPIIDIFTILVILFMYGLTLCAFAQFAPAFFAKPQLSNAFMALYVAGGAVAAPFITMLPSDATVPFALFVSPVAALFGMAPVLGGHSVTLAVPPGAVIVLLGLQVVGYAATAEYLYAIRPGDYGVPMHPLYPIFWFFGLFCSKCRRDPNSNRRGDAMVDVDHNDRIVIQNLVKYFGSQRDTAAVDHLSLRIRNKEIFALLGHNGAGKTTSISMLIGMIPATDYDACTIEGFDVAEQMDDIRRRIACCPQFDVLYDDLSGRQHLQLYAGVRGASDARAEELLAKLHLPLDDQKSSTYSGGMKRRLSVGTALVGGAPVLFLDEPSSGLDPLSRRRLWSLLKEERDSGKTIVLTTHFMEEADYLGDRIAIMSHGKLACCDTSANLKHNFGVGYYLTMVKDANNPGTFDSGVIMEVINRHCEGTAAHHHESNADATFLLPLPMVDRFGALLEELEQRLSALGASSYGVAMNSLEDVFVAITEQQEAAHAALKKGGEAAAKDRTSNAPSTVAHPNAPDHDTTRTDTGRSVAELFAAATHESFCSLLWTQILAMLIKKTLVWKRTPRLIVLGLIVPLVFVVVAYASVIPKNSFDQGSWTPWVPSTDPMPYPSLDGPLYVLLSPSNQNTNPSPFPEPPTVTRECAEKLMNEFVSRYAAFTKMQTGVAKTLSLQYVSNENAQLVQFLPMHSISWLAQPTFEVIIALNQCPDSQSDSFGWAWFLNMNYDSQVIVGMDVVLRSAAISLSNPAVPVPPVYFGHLPSIALPTQAPTPAPPTAPPGSGSGSGEADGHPRFFLETLAVIMVLGVAQFVANTALPVADELNKKSFDTLRMHGLMASSFWIGHALFDFLTAVPFIILFAFGPWARGIFLMTLPCTASVNVFALILLVTFALLSAYAIVTVLPHNAKHSTYIFVIFLCNSVCLSMPFVILALYLAANTDEPFDNPTMAPIRYITPQRAFMAIVTSQPHEHATCAWSDETHIKAIVSLVLWHILPVLVLWWQSHKDMHERSRLPEHAELPQAASVSSEHDRLLPAAAALAADSLYAAAVGTTTFDEDVAREYRRVQQQLASQHPYVSGAIANTGGEVVQGDVVDGSPVKPQHAAAPQEPDMYIVKDLRKVFYGSCLPCLGTTDKVAVNTLTFGLKRGECFGLLGPNGAGKTTSVKMMLRELVQTAGLIQCTYAGEEAAGVCGGQLPPSRGALYRSTRLGVCQQHDTLWDQLNAEEHMRLYLRVRLGSSYNSADWTNYINNALAKVQLSEGGDKASEKFSGGMKRKLSVCIAMYTGASAVFLDEPSTGMDPHARRALWKSIQEALQQDRCVLLTTHSMEEADAVCARIAIVTDGLMQCIGSSQHLKNRFGSGYSIVLTLKPHAVVIPPTELASPSTDVSAPAAVAEAPAAGDDPRGQSIDIAMQQVFGTTCQLKEALGLQRRYAVTDLNSVARAFRELAAHKEVWELDNYSVAQLTSLEQIFIEFAGWSSGNNN